MGSICFSCSPWWWFKDEMEMSHDFRELIDTAEVQTNNLPGFLDSTSSPNGTVLIEFTQLLQAGEPRRIQADQILPSRFFYSSTMACAVALTKKKIFQLSHLNIVKNNIQENKGVFFKNPDSPRLDTRTRHCEAWSHLSVPTATPLRHYFQSILTILSGGQRRKSHILKHRRHFLHGPYMSPQKDGYLKWLEDSQSSHYSECSLISFWSAKQNILDISWEIRTFLCPLKSQQTFMQGKAWHKSLVLEQT